jgi:hypothetical protein
VADWETVRSIALSLPGTEEDADGRRAYRVHGKLFAWEARERDGGGLAVRVERDEKPLILESSSDVYFSSPHYDGYPGVQIRVELIGTQELRERLEEAWLIQAPRRVASEYLAPPRSG